MRVDAAPSTVLAMDNDDINSWALKAMRAMLRRVFGSIRCGEQL